jgi:hypothetical protein
MLIFLYRMLEPVSASPPLLAVAFTLLLSMLTLTRISDGLLGVVTMDEVEDFVYLCSVEKGSRLLLLPALLPLAFMMSVAGSAGLLDSKGGESVLLLCRCTATDASRMSELSIELWRECSSPRSARFLEAEDEVRLVMLFIMLLMMLLLLLAFWLKL